MEWQPFGSSLGHNSVILKGTASGLHKPEKDKEEDLGKAFLSFLVSLCSANLSMIEIFPIT